MPLELSELICKRASIKGRLTKFKNYIDDLLQIEKLSSFQVGKLELRLTKLEALFDGFDEVQGQIELLSSSKLDDEIDSRDTVEQDFFYCIATAKELTTKYSSTKVNVDENETTVRSDYDNNMLGFRLPVIKIHNFDGSCSKWMEFRDTFQSLVHNNVRIKNIHKFHYLNSYLEGEAARVISNLEVTDANYAEAWTLLCRRYNNPRQLINNHLKSLFNIEQITRESEKSLRFLIDHVSKNLRALSTLGQPTDKWDLLIIFMVSSKLDSHTSIKWEEHKNSLAEMPTLDEFHAFLKNRADILESIQSNKLDKSTKRIPDTCNNFKPYKSAPTKSLLVSSNETSNKRYIECLVCKEGHRIYECTVFKEKSPEDRRTLASSLNLCFNCLRRGHNSRECTLLGSCRLCKKRHNSLLHSPLEVKVQPCSNSEPPVSMSSMINGEVHLCTALVDIVNPKTNQVVTARALLDSGSQTSFVSESIKTKLNLTPQPSSTRSVIGIGNTRLTLNAERCSILLRSKNSSFSVNMICLVLPQITDKLPKCFINVEHIDLSAFKLADPTYNKPSQVDVLIGADLFWDLIGSEQRPLGPKSPALRQSKLGWLIVSPIPGRQASSHSQVRCNLVQATNDLHAELTKFWELESVPHVVPLSEEEKACEKHFIANTTRLVDGRFCVKLPLKTDSSCLGDSYNVAKKRFLNLERRFRRQPEVKQLYSAFIHEYADLGHLTETTLHKNVEIVYFLPHHPVLKEQSESTKLRVVFDASARSTSGVSINDIQMIGPVIQDSLFNILIRFRQYKFVLTGDIEKMYRQVQVNETDRNLQLILWRDVESEPLRVFRLNTVTYGFSSASFLSTRCLWQIGSECVNSDIATIIQKDFYVDDLLTGCDTEHKLLQIRQEVSDSLAKGGFPLRKFRSNCPAVLDPQHLHSDSNLILSTTTKTLGLGWDSVSDQLNFTIDVHPSEVTTKRSILSSTFKIFDPLGLLSHCTIVPKILIQKLWSSGMDWDDPVPSDILSAWHRFTSSLMSISTIRVPRWVLQPNSKCIEMHSFSDASQNAYAACIYIRSTNTKGKVIVNLLCAKARVAPIKTTTIPRLELCGALLAAELSTAVRQTLRCDIVRTVYWTDSSIVLGWLQAGSHQAKTFVANRVAAINELTSAAAWRHIPTALNPADLGSRGVDPTHVQESTLWWHGPSFLSQDESTWPLPACQETVDLPELKAHTAIVVESPIPIINYSSLKRVQRVTAYILRFLYNCRNPKTKILGSLSVSELDSAFIVLLKLSQYELFSNEIRTLSNNQTLNPKSSLLPLNPFVDGDGLIRVGGRIQASEYSFDKKHPILLHSKHHLTQLIFLQEHTRLMHAGPQHLLASIRERFWPLGGRNLARRTARKCFTCRRFKGQTMQNIMGNLPAERLVPDYPFHVVGIDFAGPFMIKDRKGRGCKVSKCYMCIFICFKYKCIHLEAVSEMSKDAFILCLKRFISRRGKPKTIFCDNGRNFVAASKEINAFIDSNSSFLSDFASVEGVEFRFSPVYAPHFGGYWEAGVRSAKFHLYRVLGNTYLTYEELASLFAQVEAILNSRPLCPISSSPDDFHPLTPGHFIIGRPLTSLPSPILLDQNSNRLDRFERLESYRQHFWKRWSHEYIAELQTRSKWRLRCRDIKLNDLVLLKDDGAPPLAWRLGRVEKNYPGPDGVPRVVDVATSRGLVRRALNRICRLPSPDEEEA